ncbi:MAG: AmmeMemoRadiSam system radical SAM enzyme [Methanomethylovorans sp.]|uniref:AmmeMemoRadiSam system radical SAM enzyme n=1 Tax=Methanomethylovorans sp. TaxID=2758717 RepID=UPI000B07E7D0|nr:AmmeMemoRadiSam system radical SAM enzyme [Methanomethylovorans sp.]
MIKEAVLYDKLDGNKVRCRVCSHRCIVADGKKGFCRVRENRNGTYYTLIYNTVSSEAIDPIEKKPLFHFYPGTLAYSLGTLGCNFRCEHCQNWTISQIGINEVSTVEITPEEAVQRALAAGARTIAWTYNEPTIWYEYTYDCARLAKEAGLATAYITNGYITKEALENISPYLDAFRVDIKAFTEDFYKKVASAKLSPVLESAKLARELGIHVEVVNLVIPQYNDSCEEIRNLINWVYENLGADTPLHFTRFHPQYHMSDIISTPIHKLEEAYFTARKAGMKFVYIGNVPGHDHENTYCPVCRKLLIKRGMFSVVRYDITPEGTCPHCGEPIPIIGVV